MVAATPSMASTTSMLRIWPAHRQMVGSETVNICGSVVLVAPLSIARRQIARRAGDNPLVVATAVFDERDSRELVHQHRWIGRASVPILPHQIEMLVLVADNLMRFTL